MKILVKFFVVAILLVGATAMGHAQSYEAEYEFPKTVVNPLEKNVEAVCHITGNIATSGSPHDGNITYAGTTVLQWNACVMVASSSGTELFVKQFTATPTNYVEVLGIKFSSNGDLMVLVKFGDQIVHEGITYTSMGDADMLLVIYNSAGVYQKTYHLGGADNVLLNDVDMAPNGEYRIVGTFESTLYVDGVNTGAVSVGNSDFLLLSLDSAGYVWSSQVGVSGGVGDDEGYNIVCDASGNNYCTMHFYGSNVSFGNGIVRTVKGSRDLAVVKYSNGGVCQSVFQFGGSSSDENMAYLYLVGTKVFFMGSVSSTNNFYCINADNTIFSNFPTVTGVARNAVYAWMDFSTGIILSSGRMLSTNGDIDMYSVAAIGDTGYVAPYYGGTLTVDDGFGNNTVTFTGGGIAFQKIAVDGISTSIHQFDSPTATYGTLCDSSTNRVYVALDGGANVDLDPDPNVTVPLASNKRGVAKYNCNPVVGPTADFSGTPVSGYAPLNVQFTDSSTMGTNPITSWSWDFGDGGTSSVASPLHTYATAGTYTVRLIVSDGTLSDTEVKTNYFSVYDSLVADAGSDIGLELGQSTQFDGAYRGGSGDVTILWEGVNNSIPIDDPSILDPTVGPFSDMDVYYFALTVTDNITGCIETDTILVDVVTGIIDNDINKIKIYPNPTAGNLFINAQERLESVSIMNISGREVFHQENLGKDAQIDLSALPSGAYFVNVRFTSGNIIKKINKK